LIRGLIRECPGRGEYWVYHGIFQSDEEIKLRSFYKALQLNPKVRKPIFNAQFIGSIRTEQPAVPASERRQL
jgi:hypothetical protein